MIGFTLPIPVTMTVRRLFLQALHPTLRSPGKWIWGRGSGDDKSGVTGIMIALESLIENGFQPKRSIVLSFGFDEEASGVQVNRHSLTRKVLKRSTLGCSITGYRDIESIWRGLNGFPRR